MDLQKKDPPNRTVPKLQKQVGRFRSCTRCAQGSAQRLDAARPHAVSLGLPLGVLGAREGPAPGAWVASELDLPKVAEAGQPITASLLSVIEPLVHGAVLSETQWVQCSVLALGPGHMAHVGRPFRCGVSQELTKFKLPHRLRAIAGSHHQFNAKIVSSPSTNGCQCKRLRIKQI